MIVHEQVDIVADLLRRAARNRGVVSFHSLFKLFDEKTPKSDVYETLEAACRKCAHWEDAIYSAVMSKKDTNCPGDWYIPSFVDI